MSFQIRDLASLAYARGFTLWHYRAGADTLTAIGAAGFFNQAGDMLTRGDHVHLTMADGGAIAYVVRVKPDVVVQLMGMAHVPPAHPATVEPPPLPWRAPPPLNPLWRGGGSVAWGADHGDAGGSLVLGACHAVTVELCVEPAERDIGFKLFRSEAKS